MRLKLGIAVLVLLACSALVVRFFLAPGAAQAQDVRSNALILAQVETETPVPPTETPTPGTPSVLESWTGVPTYPESIPGHLFSVQYDTALWMRGDDLLGEPSLISRFGSCMIKQTAGRGLPPGWLVDDSFQTIGSMRYEVVRVSRAGKLQFINYFGGDGNVFTGFRVEFQYDIENCLLAAETIFTTLASVQAPTPVPTMTPADVIIIFTP